MLVSLFLSNNKVDALPLFSKLKKLTLKSHFGEKYIHHLEEQCSFLTYFMQRKSTCFRSLSRRIWWHARLDPCPNVDSGTDKAFNHSIRISATPQQGIYSNVNISPYLSQYMRKYGVFNCRLTWWLSILLPLHSYIYYKMSSTTAKKL